MEVFTVVTHVPSVIPVALAVQSGTRLRNTFSIVLTVQIMQHAIRTPHLGWTSSHFTFLPRHVQQPARDRCDSLGGRLDDELDRSPRDDDCALRGASGGRWPPRRRREEEDDDSSEFCMMKGRATGSQVQVRGLLRVAACVRQKLASSEANKQSVAYPTRSHRNCYGAVERQRCVTVCPSSAWSVPCLSLYTPMALTSMKPLDKSVVIPDRVVQSNGVNQSRPTMQVFLRKQCRHHWRRTPLQRACASLEWRRAAESAPARRSKGKGIVARGTSAASVT